jgi:hypothetical protein
VQPVTVAIETILYVILVKVYVVAFCDLVGFFPGGNFHFEQLYVAVVISMIEQGMSKLMQDGPRAMFVVG